MDYHATVAHRQAIEPTFDDAVQVSYFHSINGLKSDIFNVVEPAPGGAIRYSRAPTISEPERHSLVQTKFVADAIVKLVLSDIGLIDPTPKTVGKKVVKAVNEYPYATWKKHRLLSLKISCQYHACRAARGH